MPIFKVTNDTPYLNFPGFTFDFSIYPVALGLRGLRTAGPTRLVAGTSGQINLGAGRYNLEVIFPGLGIPSANIDVTLSNAPVLLGKEIFVRDAGRRLQPIGFVFDAVSITPSGP